MKNLKWLILPFILIAIVFGYGQYQRVLEVQSTQTNLQFLYEHFNSAGQLIDYQGEIRMKDPEQDIKVFVKDNKVTIRFGVIEMHWTAKQFMTEENLRNLALIYITVDVDPVTNRLTVYYKGQELPRWVS